MQSSQRLIRFLLWIVTLITFDQLVKAWARTQAQGIEGRTFSALIPNIFELKLVYNKGIAFGMAQGAGVFLTPIAIIITGYAIYHIAKSKNDPPGVFTGLVLLASGAVGNLIDRLSPMGKVTDMFYFRLIDFPVFNVADTYITCAGAIIIFLGLKDAFAKKPEPIQSEIEDEPSLATEASHSE
ncbi:MAG: signal peptidase II [Fimbriimonadaceae bacterium]